MGRNPHHKKRKDILYRLRKKGFRVETKVRIIYFPYGQNPDTVVQARRLRSEFNFTVQFEL
jgi:hypothetical protein